ncbi:MAG: pyridoxal 5'-phosphate synthase glutaminase subunit PdxT [Mycobacteriales bacterium]
MTGPQVGVLALQGDVREHDRALRTAGADPVHVRRAEDLERVDGLVLPGGESTTISRLLGVFELLEPLRLAVAGGLPVYGSCAGMILLATEVLDGRPDQQGLGGLDIVVRRNAFGRQVDSFETDLDFDGVGDMHAVFIRAPWVERAGEQVQVLARVPSRGSADLPGAAGSAAASRAAGKVVAVRQGSVLATSFHPELTGDGRVHALFVKMIKEARG